MMYVTTELSRIYYATKPVAVGIFDIFETLSRPIPGVAAWALVAWQK